MMQMVRQPIVLRGLILGTLSILVLVLAIFSWPRTTFLTVAFLDVGQGDAIYIEAPNGNQMLVDGGRDTKVLTRLSEVMPFGDRSIEVVIGTHPDEDHIGGLVDVLTRYSVEAVIEPGMPNDTGAWNSFVSLVTEEGIDHFIGRAGMLVDLGSGVTFRILYPDTQITGGDTNLSSIVGILSYGESDFMLTGDAPQSVEASLVKKFGNALASEVLKAGHHGSKTSSAPQFVDAVSPTFGIISAGKDNRYGHPHQQTIDVFTKRDVRILSTSEGGSIIFRSDGTNLQYLE